MHAFEVEGLSREEAIDRLKAIDSIGVAERAWLSHAISVYPDFEAQGLKPVQGLWTVQGVTADSRRELYAWGRGYSNSDGSRRVHVLPTNTGRRPDAVKVAVAAFTAAFGRLATWPSPWSNPFALVAGSDNTAPAEVIVRALSLYDGSFEDVFAGSREEAREFYDDVGRPAASSAIEDGAEVPSSKCAPCKFLDGCETVPRASGLLGLNNPKAPLRSVSATTLRYHSQCPRQMSLRALNVPPQRRESDSVRVGRIVDATLDSLHKEPEVRPCTSARITELLAERGDIDASDRERAAHLLAQHVCICPWIAGASSHPLPHPEVVAFDDKASALVVAEPDLLYSESGELVWRETTTSKYAPRGTAHLFATRKHIQLALAVLLCAAEAVSKTKRVARIEVEYLTDSGADVRILDPHDLQTQAGAREVINGVAPDWFTDSQFPARPGDACRFCAYTEWCPDVIESETQADADD
ncbi:PD-(D/E)XK nuclease family protein [Nocardioides sp. WG-D5]